MTNPNTLLHKHAIVATCFSVKTENIEESHVKNVDPTTMIVTFETPPAGGIANIAAGKIRDELRTVAAFSENIKARAEGIKDGHDPEDIVSTDVLKKSEIAAEAGAPVAHTSIRHFAFKVSLAEKLIKIKHDSKADEQKHLS